jgi:hypothetical protein
VGPLPVCSSRPNNADQKMKGRTRSKYGRNSQCFFFATGQNHLSLPDASILEFTKEAHYLFHDRGFVFDQ